MTVTTLKNNSPETQTFHNPIAVRFFENLDSAIEEIKNNGNLSIFISEHILENSPVLSNSPEKIMQHYSEIANIESKLRTYAK